MWMKGIRNCTALLLIVYYKDSAAYPILASFLFLFILPLTSTWSSVFTCPSPVKEGFASWPIPKEKSWLVSIRKAKTREAWPRLQPNNIHRIPRFILWVSSLFPTPTVSSLCVDHLLILVVYSTELLSMQDTLSCTCNTKQYFFQNALTKLKFLTKKYFKFSCASRSRNTSDTAEPTQQAPARQATGSKAGQPQYSFTTALSPLPVYLCQDHIWPTDTFKIRARNTIPVWL